MKNIGIVSPLELWQDFDPEEGELHTVHLRTVNDGLTVTKSMYFDAYVSPNGATVRGYGELKYTHAAFAENKGFLPVILMSADMYADGTRDCIWQMTGAGYAVFCLDYSGDETKPRCSLYPDSLGYARNTNGVKYTVEGDPKATSWYIWTAMTRRAITLLDEQPETDATRLGVIGLRDGGMPVASLAALDERVKSVAIIGNTGWRNYGPLYDTVRECQLGFFDEEQAAFNSSLSVEAYARFVKKPVLWIFGTNDTHNDFDRAFDTFARLPENPRCALCVSPRADGSIRYEQLGNLRHWMDCNILYKGVYYGTPELEAYVSESRQYVRCRAECFEHVTGVDFYYAYNEQDYRIRNWYRADELNVSENEWIAALDIADKDKYVFCFAVVTYDNGVTVSSKQIAKKPVGVVPTQKGGGRLIYDSESGKDCFTVVHTGGLFDYREELELAKGPIGIVGIQANVGSLATFKLADPRYRGFDGDLLGITYYAPHATLVELKLGVLRNNKWTEYSYALDAEGGEFWQKAALRLSEFKDAQGYPLGDWGEVKRFVVSRPRGKTFLLSTLLWV